MNKLYERLSNYTLEDALNLELKDRQFIALEKLWKKLLDKELFLALTISNSIICYQLSWKWENYWEEFSDYFTAIEVDRFNFLDKLSFFISQSKNNKRFVSTKQWRIEKIRPFIDSFFWKGEYYYKNMTQLRDELSKTMKQKKDAKTIVFAVKMFWYSSRILFDFIEYPEDVSIPIDSRLSNLFEIYKWEYEDINLFYSDLSNNLKISPLHLDWIVWNLYEKLIVK